ncbi:MAG: IS30 family transposase [Patescibacteria group bacterium]
MATQYNHFTKSERNELSILLKKGYSQRSIADALGKSPPSIGREIKKNSVNGVYEPEKANVKARVRRQKSKYQAMKITSNSKLEAYVIGRLKAGWSPQAIVERLRVESGGKSVISFKLVYQWLQSPRGQQYRMLLPAKRSGWQYYRKGSTSTPIKDRVFIDERPRIINGRARVGDFECDVLGSLKRESQRVVGVVDRKARYLDLQKVSRMGESMSAYQDMLWLHRAKSGTFDNGIENAHHQVLGIPTYFCRPYSPWQKGTVENTFQRLRRFIPKKAMLSKYSNEDISGIVDTMNATPRECLGWKMPREIFFSLPLEQTYVNFQYSFALPNN